MKESDLYYSETMQMASQAQSTVVFYLTEISIMQQR